MPRKGRDLPTDNDVTLSEHRTMRHLELMDLLKRPLQLLCASPLAYFLVYRPVSAVAGETTALDATLSFNIQLSLTLATTGISGLLLYKNRAQRRVILRLRGKLRDAGIDYDDEEVA